MIAYVVFWELAGKNSTMSSVFILTYGARISWILGSKRLVIFLSIHNKKCIYIIYILLHRCVFVWNKFHNKVMHSVFWSALWSFFIKKKNLFFKDQQISFETHTYIYSFFLFSNTPHKACLVFSYIEVFKHF